MAKEINSIWNDAGHTLIGLLAMMAVSSILLATIAPTWGFIIQRDKEEELIFRGESYKTAIERYQKEFNKLPSKLEELTKGKFIRKLYVDPMTGYDFELILQAPEGRKRESELTKSQQEGLRGAPGGGSLGIVGVVSLSDETAIRPYQDKEKYNEWEFIAGEGNDDQNRQGGGDGDDDDDDDGIEGDR